MKPFDSEDHIKKVKIVYELVLFRHKHELNITNDLNRKATDIVLFSGILVGFISNIVANSISNNNKIPIAFQLLGNDVQLYFSKLLIISLLIFISSIILGLFSIFLDKWEYVKNDPTCPYYIINEYLTTDANFNATVEKMSMDIAFLTENTIKVNKQKYKLLKGSAILFSFGIMLLFLTIELFVKFV